MMPRRAILSLPAAVLSESPCDAWPLWPAAARRLITPEGRVLDFSSGNRTTSEGQAYCLFFSLITNDQTRFGRILQWTRNHLAGGDLAANLPAWLFGAPAAGVPPSILDANSAADADLWIAYTLLQAGRHWRQPRYEELGLSLVRRIAASEVASVPGFGPLLLPAPQGFRPGEDILQFNPSYVPLQLITAFAAVDPRGPWAEMARTLPAFIEASAPHGFALDWLAHHAGEGFAREPVPSPPPVCGFEAIRVYLWAGMLHTGTPGRARILRALHGPARLLRAGRGLPARVTPEGVALEDHEPLGYSAALLPYLHALDERPVFDRLQTQVQARFAPQSSSWRAARYYDLCLALFALGWTTQRYRFAPDGNLRLKDTPIC